MRILRIGLLILMTATSYGQLPQGVMVYHHVEVVNVLGQAVDLTAVYIYNPGTSDEATIYKARESQSVITQPMTSSSTNTTLNGNKFYWYGPDGWDYRIETDTEIQDSSNRLTLSAARAEILKEP
jgi:hypothetical protein